MLKIRVIPCLLLRDEGLVKTIKFKNPVYVGDPINAIKIFNDKEVDELVFLDIDATRQNREPNFKVIEEIASECFMPLAYGGGIKTIGHIRQILKLGVEKVIINSAALTQPSFIKEASDAFGSSTIVVSIDFKKNWRGNYEVYTHNGKNKTKKGPVAIAKKMEEEGAGEILLNAIDRDGVMKGYDLNLLNSVTQELTIPVVCSGGAGKIEDFGAAVHDGGASAVAAGSLFVFHGPHKAVLINYPAISKLENILNKTL